MGNACAGTTNAGGANGFIQSVTQAVWRQRPADELQGDNKRNAGTDAADNASPDPVKTQNDESKKEERGKHEPKPPRKQIKRLTTMQRESVLGRKTGNIKEIYSLGRKLWQGQFGTTFLCVEKCSGKRFACKSIAKRKLTSTDDLDNVRREIWSFDISVTLSMELLSAQIPTS
ncbi:hypothetical protein F3Y22_tig00005939pilonHSYRG00169 [Hibiscus syriacus]|uniref:Protein kinase domain-containing protein n=1 Tax=Hibiscus syriacus TaxID=106335 RepID=A0A6A3CEC2_HIBSY|nr:hypothetical protein F3Y22_tig00005939pilonHSYRG00169 [Hibiscus syriacus]